jgi:tungstate transport system ATP-binding protein
VTSGEWGGACSPLATTHSPLVEVRGLVVRRGRRVILELPELAVRRGELLAVIGPNGAGKSTLATVLALLERPSEGELWFDGKPVDWRRDGLGTRRRLAMVFQEPLLFDTSVFENVATGLRLRGVHGPEVRSRAELWLERLNIAHLAPRAARTLSGGEAQRTSLARALVLDPELLLLDEPFGALDPPTRGDLIADLLPLLRRQATTTLLVTHDHDEAIELGDRLAVLLGGRLAQLDRPEHILEQPADPAVAAFVRPRGVRRTRDRDRGCERSATSGRDCQPGQPGHDARARGSDLTG